MEDFDYDLQKLMAIEKMDQVIENYQFNLNRISTGRANPAILDSIKIDYFGTKTPINQLASISVPESRQLLIKPYDRAINRQIIGAINGSSLGVSANDEGDKSRIIFPELTLQRRKELVKSIGSYTEQARVQVRMVRQEINREIKSADLSQDITKDLQEDVQKLIDQYINKIQDMTKDKEANLLKI